MMQWLVGGYISLLT